MSVISAKMTENKLIGRRVVLAHVSYQKPLTRDEMKHVLAEYFKVDPSNVVIRKADFITGTKTVNIHAHIYGSVEDIKKYEPTHILIRNKIVEKVKK
ncbi:MAG: hypothetical protein QXR26_00245 [Candidatus Caldarchaeum sp.]